MTFRFRRGSRRLDILVSCAVLVGAMASRRASAYDILGPNKCTSCHDHEPQKDWAEKKEGPKGHLNALSQLEDKRSAGWGKAIGLGDVYDLKGTCVKCHATVFKGDANAGVSCETCHGPGSGYNEPHQQKGSYRKAVELGMYDTRVKDGGSYAIWAKMCLDCHVMTDQKLVTAGHPSGAGFDLAVKSFGQVVHWKDAYDKNALAAAGRAYLAKKGIAAPAPKGGEKPPEPPPAAKPTPAQAAPKATAAPAQPAPKATAAPAQPAPKATAAPAPTAAPKGVPAAPTPKPEGPKAQPSAAPAAKATPAPVAPATPEATPAPEVPPPTTVAPPPPPPPLPAGPPMGLVPEIAAARGKILTSLASRVGQPAKPPAVAPLPTAGYRGPDGELLRLQDEVLELTLRSLSTSTPAKEKKP